MNEQPKRPTITTDAGTFYLPTGVSIDPVALNFERVEVEPITAPTTSVNTTPVNKPVEPPIPLKPIVTVPTPYVTSQYLAADRRLIVRAGGIDRSRNVSFGIVGSGGLGGSNPYGNDKYYPGNWGNDEYVDGDPKPYNLHYVFDNIGPLIWSIWLQVDGVHFATENVKFGKTDTYQFTLEGGSSNAEAIETDKTYITADNDNEFN